MLNRTKQVLVGITVGALVFTVVALLVGRINDNKEEVNRLEAISADIKAISLDVRATLEELRAAIAAGPEATEYLLARIREEMERDHDELLRAIRDDEASGGSSGNGADKNGKDKDKPKPRPSGGPFPNAPVPPPFPPFLFSSICSILPFC